MYGFPIDHNGAQVSVSKNNHKGVQDPFLQDIDSYLDKEIQCGVVIGPFPMPSFRGPVAISPLNSVLKRGSQKRRVT